MKCLFHIADADGKLSATIVKKKYPECELIGIDFHYDYKPILKKLIVGEIVFIVDFSFPRKIMESLLESQDLVWIDHHETPIKKYGDLKIAGVRDMDFSACELTWRYLHPDQPMPEIVYLIGRRDVWDYKNINWQTISKFHYGLESKDTDPRTALGLAVWEILFYQESMRNKLIEEGGIIKTYMEKVWENSCKSYSFECELGGLKFLALNSNLGGSEQFKSLYNENKYDAVLKFTQTPNHYACGIYTSKKGVDLTVIAEKFGGGGHIGSAGFSVKNLFEHIKL